MVEVVDKGKEVGKDTRRIEDDSEPEGGNVVGIGADAVYARAGCKNRRSH